jgi:UDP-N-acetylglucosamine 3-dehydrogenase
MALNIAVIGCGVVGQGHLEAIQKLDEWNLIAVTEPNRERLDEVTKRYRLQHGFEDYRQMLDTIPLDGVVVATHMETHHEITLAALQKGIHVLCEKPMAETMEKCREMVEVARENKRLLAINFNTRSADPYLTIQNLMQTKDMGNIRVVRFVYDWSAHQWQPPQRFEKFMDNGGPVIDSAVHFFDGVRWFTGAEFERIEACGVRIAPHQHPQHVISTCQLSDGAIALVEAGWLFTKRTKDASMLFEVTVIGDNGTISYNADSGLIRVWTLDETYEIECDDLEKHFEKVHQAFAHSIQRGELVGLASGEDGLLATEAAYCALSSTMQ